MNGNGGRRASRVNSQARAGPPEIMTDLTSDETLQVSGRREGIGGVTSNVVLIICCTNTDIASDLFIDGL